MSSYYVSATRNRGREGKRGASGTLRVSSDCWRCWRRKADCWSSKGKEDSIVEVDVIANKQRLRYDIWFEQRRVQSDNVETRKPQNCWFRKCRVVRGRGKPVPLKPSAFWAFPSRCQFLRLNCIQDFERKMAGWLTIFPAFLILEKGSCIIIGIAGVKMLQRRGNPNKDRKPK